MRFARAWSAVIGVFAAGAAACGTVLGLGDYRDAPRDAGATAQGDAESSETRDAGPPPALDAGQEATDAADGAALDPADGGGQDAADDMEQDAPFDGATTMDAASTDASLCVGTDAMSCFSVPGGWTLVAFANSSQTACPAGFSLQNDVVFGAAQPAANACTCDSCSVTAQPSCVQGPLNGTEDFDGSQTCRAGSVTLANSSPGGCNTDNFHGRLRNFDVQLTAPAPTGGTCSAAPTAHADRISFAGQGRACSPQSDAAAGCVGGVCAPTIVAPFLLCLSQAGNAACPAGPFGVAYHVGTGAVPTCAAACACTVNATCTNKVVTYYPDGACQSAMTLPIPANGVCQVVTSGMGIGSAFGSYMYSATVNATCGVTGNPAVSAVGLANQETICCAQ
jgi:hypothetical protein